MGQVGRKLQLYGVIDKSGTNPNYSGLEKYKQFLKENAGKAIVMELSTEERNTTNHHIWYIMKMILPAWIKGNSEKGNALTPEEALNDIRYSCPLFYETSNVVNELFDWRNYEPNCSMEPFELECCIEWLHFYCLENFNIPIGNLKLVIE